MKAPVFKHTHLWNDLPDDERVRLFPYMIENQMLILWQARQRSIKSHERHMREIDSLMQNLEHELSKY